MVQQFFPDLHQRRHELRVLGEALRRLQRARGDGLFQALPRLCGGFPRLHLGLRHTGLGERLLGIREGLVERVARGGPARCQCLVAAEHGRRQPAVDLQPLNRPVDRDQGRRALAFVARGPDLLQRAMHIQHRG